MSADQSEPNPTDQLLDYFVYAPVGIALEAVDNLPKFIERGKSQVTIGRFLAKTAAKKGGSTVESMAERFAQEAGQIVVDLFGIDLTPDAPAEDEPLADVVSLAPAAADLPIAEYDSQAAAQIVKLLPQLSTDELRQINAFERAGRNRVTILRKIEQLQGAG
ncbi:MAG: hypothetical protein ACR2P0_08570 [Acidimicrobiales bacterium]